MQHGQLREDQRHDSPPQSESAGSTQEQPAKTFRPLRLLGVPVLVVALAALFMAIGGDASFFGDDPPVPATGGGDGPAPVGSDDEATEAPEVAESESATPASGGGQNCQAAGACHLVSRGELTAYLARALSIPEKAAIPEDAANPGVFSATGVGGECNPGSSCEDEPVTRAEAAAVVSRSLGLAPTAIDHFDDDDGHLYERDIDSLAEAGVSLGCRADSFCPDQNLTRLEMAPLVIHAFQARPVGLEREPSPPGGDVFLSPDDDVSAIVEASPEGTVFVFGPGRYMNVRIEPKDGQVFIGEPGAVLDGDGTTKYAFISHGSDVVISGLEITGYAPKIQHAPIIAKTHEKQEGGIGWVVENCEIHHNATAGISLSDRSVMRGNSVHHNGQIGVKVSWAPNGALVEDNEIYSNNYENLMEGWEDGGSKFSSSDGLVLRGNYVYDNHGPGLWGDIDNINTVYENNVVVDNKRLGIYHEISYSAVIRHNIVTGNGWGKDSWLWGAGIAISASQDVEVAGNLVVDNGDGIALIQQDRGAGDYGPYLVQNVEVHHNTVVMSGEQQTGAVQDVGDDAIFADRNNRFHDNVYVVDDPGRSHWIWGGDNLDLAGWQAAGHRNETATRP